MNIPTTLVHHHLLYYASVGRTDLDHTPDTCKKLEDFLFQLVAFLDMKILGENGEGNPRAVFGRQNHAWSGVVMITTSHIAFHYFMKEQYIQCCIYSCKPYSAAETIQFLNNFWQGAAIDALFIDRDGAQSRFITSSVA